MSKLTHIDADGRATMVDVSAKAVTERLAVASSTITMRRETLDAIRERRVVKGDVLNTARIAGIQAAKRCDELIPLCHALPLSAVDVDFREIEDPPGLAITASARVAAQTGVEMEALTAASTAALTVYDMAKAVDRAMEIGGLRVVLKDGGKSGRYEAE